MNVFAAFALVVVAVSAAPVDEQARKQVNQAVRIALEPVMKEADKMYVQGQRALGVVGNEAISAGERVLGNAKEMLNSVQKAERADLPNELQDRAADLANDLQEDSAKLMERAVEQALPFQDNLRSMARGVQDAMEALQTKYLTDDGKALVKNMVDVAARGIPGIPGLPDQAKAGPMMIAKQ